MAYNGVIMAHNRVILKNLIEKSLLSDRSVVSIRYIEVICICCL